MCLLEAGGPLNVTYLRSPSPINDAFLAACEANGVAHTPDYNGALQDSCWLGCLVDDLKKKK